MEIFALFALMGAYINFDTTSAVLFLIIVLGLIAKYRKKLHFQPMLRIGKVPLIYAVLWKTQFGLKFMERVSKKYRETIKLIGYCFIGFGFFGLVFISLNILWMLFKLFVSPRAASEGVALVLPLTNIPGVGYLSFWHFLITLFVVVLIHEFAHGIVARAHNVPVKSSGLGVFSLILPVFPLAFVEPDEKKMTKSSDIVQYSILAAGPMINVFFAVLVLLFSNLVMVPVENTITHPIGFSFTDVMEGYGAQEAGMEGGMIITRVNGEEILEYQDFSRVVGDPRPGETVTLGTADQEFIIVTKPAPEDTEKGYIGILGIQNERRVNEGYAHLGGAFFWLKGLVKWLYFINVAIGLMNLLPLLVTDGGRMLKLALERVYTNKKRAEKAWSFIGMLFIFTLLAAFAIKYIGGLFV